MVHVNTEKNGHWAVLEKSANKELFLKEPPPVLPEFHIWFNSRFPDLEEQYLVKSLIHRVIINSIQNKQTPLASDYLRNLMNLTSQTEFNVKDIIDCLSEALDIDYSGYSRVQGLARNIQISKKSALKLMEQWNSFAVKKNDSRYSEAVSAITGKSIHDPDYQKIIRESKDCIRNHTIKQYKKDKHPLTKIINYLNNRKIPEIVIDRLDAIIDKCDSTDSFRYARLLGCRNNLIGNIVWKINEQGYRIFPVGESLSTIKREDRWDIMMQEDGFYEIDLTNAHFAILAFLIQGKEMSKMLDNGSIWSQLLTYLNLDKSFKSSLKECIYSILYGSGEDLQKILLIQNSELRGELKDLKESLTSREKSVKTSEEKTQFMIEKNSLVKRIKAESSDQDKELYSKLISHPAIAELLTGSKVFHQQILAVGSFTDAFGILHQVKDFGGEGKIINTIMASYEKVLLMPIYQEAFYSKAPFEVLLDQHDGMTLYLKNNNQESINYLEILKNKVDQKAKELKINTKVEIKK